MSIKLMSLVFDTTFQPTPKIVLMALADRADDTGGSLWPGVKEVARKSSLSERQAQRVLHWLDELKLVPVMANQYGGKPGETTHRRINLDLLREYATGKPAPRMSTRTGDKTAPVQNGETGDMEDAGRVTPETETGDTHVTQYISDPSMDTPPPLPPEGEGGGDDLMDVLSDPQPQKTGLICRTLKAAGITRVNPSHPKLQALVAAGVTEQELLGYVERARTKGDGFAWLLESATQERIRVAQQAAQMHRGAMPTAPTETAYQRSMREKYAALVPMVAAKAPGAAAEPIPFLDMEVSDAPRRLR